MSRYLYEHLFLGHLHFETDPQHRWFSIVRSTTPSGVPIAPSRRVVRLTTRKSRVSITGCNPSAKRCSQKRTCHMR